MKLLPEGLPDLAVEPDHEEREDGEEEDGHGQLGGVGHGPTEARVDVVDVPLGDGLGDADGRDGCDDHHDHRDGRARAEDAVEGHSKVEVEKVRLNF